MNQLRRGRVQGPLASFAVRFRQELADGGYAVRSAETHLLLMARLSRWLEQTSLDPGELGVARVEEFLRWNQAEGYRFPKSVRGAELLLGFLRGLGVIPGPPAPMLSAGEQLLARFMPGRWSRLEPRQALCRLPCQPDSRRHRPPTPGNPSPDQIEQASRASRELCDAPARELRDGRHWQRLGPARVAGPR